MDLDEVDRILFLNTRVPHLQFYLFIVINKLLFVLFLEATNKSVCHSFLFYFYFALLLDWQLCFSHHRSFTLDVKIQSQNQVRKLLHSPIFLLGRVRWLLCAYIYFTSATVDFILNYIPRADGWFFEKISAACCVRIVRWYEMVNIYHNHIERWHPGRGTASGWIDAFRAT